MPRLGIPFWDRVDKSDDCWLWTGSKDGDGYGSVRFNGRMDKAHRVAWRLTNGPIYGSLHVLHRCDNPPCVRPDHLFLGTNKDNARDRHSKGRSKNLFRSDNHPSIGRTGELHWCAKLTDADVSLLRQLRADGVSVNDLARKFNINHGTVSRIARGIWR